MKTVKMIATMLAAVVLTANVSIANKKTPNKAVALKVDVAKSILKWDAKKVTGEHNGTVGISSGSISINGSKIVGGEFEIDMNSIKCDDLKDAGYNGKLIGHLKSDDFFSVAKNPKANFKITKATGSKGQYNITGNMTIKGITKSITFPATVTIGTDGITATAKIVLDRTLWDIRYGSKKFFDSIGDKAIYDDFTMDLTLTATK
jgi:polyisoprenoid-binding protein YceI